MKGRITQVSSRSRTRGKTDFKSIKGFSPPSGPVGTPVTITGVSLTQTSQGYVRRREGDNGGGELGHTSDGECARGL